MKRSRDDRAQKLSAFVTTMRSADWAMIVLVAGFVLVVPLRETVGSPVLWVSRLFGTDPADQYERALAAAALKRPDYEKKLDIPATDPVNVVTFQTRRDLPLHDRNREIWVGLRDQVRKACLGAANPVRKLQQVLGLPPAAARNSVVTEFEVPRTGLFRPCIGSSEIASDVCEFKLPAAPAKDADAATIRGAYDHLRFLTKQMWTSYRTGFRREPTASSDYPFTGHPFTGMGWTFDWSDSSRDHFGVSEFVIKRDAVIKIVSEKTPADFCAETK